MLVEEVEIVDSDNNVVGIQKRSIVYRDGLIHRASHIFLKNDHDEIYTQMRSGNRKTWPNKWDLSAAETLKPGESYEEGASRGLREELGIKNTNLKMITGPYLAKYHDEFSNLKPSVFVGLFLGDFNEEITPDNEEVSEGKFINSDDINSLVATSSNQLTAWFIEDWNRLKNYFSKSSA